MTVRAKITILLLGLAGLIATAALCIAIREARPKNPSAIDWPSTRVVRITARLLQEPESSPFATDFEIEPSAFGTILDALSPAIPFDEAPKVAAIGPELEGGRIKIEYAEGPAVDVVFYLEGQNPLVFMRDGRFFLRGGRHNRRLREDHRRIYGLDYGAAIDESNALTHLLKSEAKAGRPAGPLPFRE